MISLKLDQMSCTRWWYTLLYDDHIIVKDRQEYGISHHNPLAAQESRVDDIQRTDQDGPTLCMLLYARSKLIPSATTVPI